LSPAKDNIQLYFRDIGVIPLLTREEEVALAKKVAKGDEHARLKMIKSNLRLVVNIARKYMHYGVPLLDLIEEGNIGLMRAVEKFDVERGNRLSTYASWWIRQSIMRALAKQGKMVRVPMYMIEKINKVKKKINELTQRYGRPAKTSEVARALKIPKDKIRELLEMDQKTSSLHASIDSEGISELIEVIEDEDSIPPSKMISDKVIRGRIADLLDQLTEREAGVLRLRFGIEDNNPRTLMEIGKIYGITRERVRQVQEAGLFKLKTMLNEQKSKFEDF
jgi:RNA polymerase primary sigma factor